MKRNYRIITIIIAVFTAMILLASCKAATPDPQQPDSVQIPEDIPPMPEEVKYASAALQAKLTEKLASPDPIESYAWSMIEKNIRDQWQLSEVIFTDAEITLLECTDRFSDFYEDKEIGAYALEYRIKPEDQEKIILAGGMEIDDDGWLLDTVSMGHPWIITEEQEDAVSPISWVYPMGEGRGVALTTLDMLMNRDLERSINIDRLAILSVEQSISYYDGQIVFQIPKIYPYHDAWVIDIIASAEDENYSFDLEFSEDKLWENDGYCFASISDIDYNILFMSITIQKPESGQVIFGIDLSPYIKDNDAIDAIDIIENRL
ncbi:MAG: hypothetical protein FWG43_00145 [Clostridiales bacterium]|nr:hypothetical protein [Clostridiales bacterium]